MTRSRRQLKVETIEKWRSLSVETKADMLATVWFESVVYGWRAKMLRARQRQLREALRDITRALTRVTRAAKSVPALPPDLMVRPDLHDASASSAPILSSLADAQAGIEAQLEREISTCFPGGGCGRAHSGQSHTRRTHPVA